MPSSTRTKTAPARGTAPLKRLYIIANPRRKPGVDSVLAGLLPRLRELAQIVRVDHRENSSLKNIAADLVLVFGGDGSILSAARRLGGSPVPVMGVNMGRLGFLAEVSPEDLCGVLPRILEGHYILSPRMMLDVEVHPPKGRVRHFCALNDAVLLRLPNAQMMGVRVVVSGEQVAHYKGDGLIVATATGSTGYNLSAGGPILSERLKAMIVTPVCPHTLANRPIVLSGDEALDVTPETRNGKPVELVLDGQVHSTLPHGATVRIQRSRREVNLLSTGQKGRYEIIRDKLHWAGWVKDND